MRNYTIVAQIIACSIAIGAAASACGGKTPPANPENTETTTTPPSASSSGPAAETTTPAPSATTETAPTPPPPEPKKVELPASFTTAQTAYFTQSDRLGEVVTAANGDCKKMGAGLNKVAGDPAFAKALKDYVTEAMKLDADQKAAAKAAYEDNQKKFDGLKGPADACKKDPSIKKGMDKIGKILLTTLQPLIQAFGSAQ